MADFKNVESIYRLLHETATIISEKEQVSYLDALIMTGENLVQGGIQDKYDEQTKNDLIYKYESLSLDELSKEEIRKGYQLAILKGMQDGVQSQHAMTPDAVALFVGYLVEKTMSKKERITLLDPAIGTGNLVSAVLNQTKMKVFSYGSEVDETLIKLAYVNMNAQEHDIQLYHQDSLQSLMIDPVDLVITDLPVGYYPNDDMASKYRLKADTGHSFSHHLMIEQALNHTKEGGFLFFLIPNFLFAGDQAQKLNKYLREEAVIHGLLQLPLTMFKKEEQAKSIFFIQKKGEEVTAPKEALMAELPSFSDPRALQSIMEKIDAWFKTSFTG
ncbi:class I SAM-dependent methyltransferase [Pseudalkalibacillus salsuginis]|uniref:class I SAM-dependent methyltransferase n=1 Tax=Pseudalkalibacillus salsuginis TaxID=2910972 RepID=UPI001F1FAAE1|nr:class I SAM-dependent methyltransferase [Pseudalkalibacillus salsuginis]MCF6408771.1 class I SAM-dependent methyltransferase [Pseudalkalibacillus salsuginis]